MAKFAQIELTSKETAYGTPATAIVLAAAMNSTVEFTPVLKPGGTPDDLNVNAQYNINRAKRVKAKAVANQNVVSTANALAMLDNFSEIDWTALGVVAGNLRSIGVKRGMLSKETLDPDAIGTTDAKAIADHVAVEAIEATEQLMQEMLTGAKAANVTTLAAAAAGTVPIFDYVESKATEITLFSDEYKHTTSEENIVVFMNPLLKNRAIKEIGQEFNNEAPIYKTGIKSKFSIAGFPVIFDATLNKYEKTDVKDRYGIIVTDIESLAFKKDTVSDVVNQPIGIFKFMGKFYYTIKKLVDTERTHIATFDATGMAAKTPLVSD